jgi:putative hydrolase of the HAD superfamily
VSRAAPVPHAIPRVGGEPPLRAVLFDAGLTLIRSVTPAEEVAAEALAEFGIVVDPPELALAMQRTDNYLVQTWHQGDWWASETTVRRLFVNAYRAGLADLPPIGGDDALLTRLAELVYVKYHESRHWALFPDVLPTLDALRAADVTLGVVSDWGHGLESILLELELGEYFAFLVVSSRLGIAKPDPGVFEMALNRIGVPARDAVYIGDTYVKDVLGARAAGLTPVLLDRSGEAPPADCLKVRSLTDLLQMVGVKAVDVLETVG